MPKPKTKRAFKPGDSIHREVSSDAICDSDPCNKDNCMLTRAITTWLVETYGGSARSFKVKSTNHGVTFELYDRKYVAVFDTRTATTIYKYDQIYRQTRSKEKARASVKPFTARIMIEATSAVTKWPAMTEEAKAHLRSMPKKKKGAVYVPKTTGTRRELSL